MWFLIVNMLLEMYLSASLFSRSYLKTTEWKQFTMRSINRLRILLKSQKIYVKINLTITNLSLFQNFRIQELRERSLDLHRDISSALRELSIPRDEVDDFVLPGDVPLFPAKIGEPGYLGDNKILGILSYKIFF